MKFSALFFIIISAAVWSFAGEWDDQFDFRDPFWPVGYAPAKEEVPAPAKADEKPAEVKKTVVRAPRPQPDWPAAMRCLKISGYAESNGARTCIINGKTVTEGDLISIVNGMFRYTWKIDKISPQKSQMKFSRQSVGILPKE